MPQFAAGTCFRVGATFLPERAYRSVTLALESGIRHIDTALVYRSHRQINSVLSTFFANGQLARDDVFVTSKVLHGPMNIPSFNEYDSTLDMDSMTVEQIAFAILRHVERTLDELGVGYVDLLLLHWPTQWNTKGDSTVNREKRLAAWKILEQTLHRGWARAIGVSNFSEIHLRQLEEDGATVRPMVNQIETSVYVQYDDIIKYCRENNIVVQAFSPLGAPESGSDVNALLADPVLNDLAMKYDKNVGQIALRYLVQKGLAITALSTSEHRIKSNLDIFNFSLEDTDMEKLNGLKGKKSMLGLPSPYDLS